MFQVSILIRLWKDPDLRHVGMTSKVKSGQHAAAIGPCCLINKSI